MFWTWPQIYLFILRIKLYFFLSLFLALSLSASSLGDPFSAVNSHKPNTLLKTVEIRLAVIFHCKSSILCVYVCFVRVHSLLVKLINNLTVQHLGLFMCALHIIFFSLSSTLPYLIELKLLGVMHQIQCERTFISIFLQYSGV